VLLSNSFKTAWPYFFIGVFMEGVRVTSGAVALGTHVTMQVQRSLRSYIVGVGTLALGMAAGKIFNSFILFTAILATGCAGHLAVMLRDVSHHLNARMSFPAARYFVGLFLVTCVHFAGMVLGAGAILQVVVLAVGALLYALLLLNLNTEFSHTR
jgi:hypothetical protein